MIRSCEHEWQHRQNAGIQDGENLAEKETWQVSQELRPAPEPDPAELSREDFLQGSGAREIEGRDIGIVWVQGQEVLMIGVSWIKACILSDLRGNRLWKRFCLGELDAVGICNPNLLRRRCEDLRSVLRSLVRILLVELRWVRSL